MPATLTAPAPSVATATAGPRLLVVDDDALTLDALGRFLRSPIGGGTGADGRPAGYQVDCANDGSQAIELLAQRPYAVVITDINMPRTNGLELLRFVRQHHPGTVVLVVTGYGTTKTRQGGDQAGGVRLFDQADGGR